MRSGQESLERWLSRTTTFLKKYFHQNADPQTKVVDYFSPSKLREDLDLTLGPSSSEDETWRCLEQIMGHSVRTSHPLFLNQLFGGVQPESLSADIMTSALNATMATFEVAPVLTLIEKELSRKLCDLIGFKLGEGIMVTGGSNANLVGLLCARQFKVPDIKKRGYENKNYIVYVSADAHYSYEKAVHIAGLGTDQLRLVNLDANGAMDPAHLRELIHQDQAQGFEPMMIGATMGTTVRGAFDPLAELNLIARENNLWLHADAAWGGGAALSEKHRPLLNGIHLADSVTFDAHKTLSTGLITSFVLCKHPGMLRQMNQGGGSEYIFHDYDNSDWDTGTYSLQCGRRADALKLWLLWKSRGDRGMEAHIDHLFDLTTYAKNKITLHPRMKLLSSQYLNNCFQIIPVAKNVDMNQFTLKVRTHLVKNGRALVNYVQKPDGTTFFRLVTSNNQTTQDHIDRLFVELDESIKAIDSLC